jgi:nucleotide-binding universal stress UspA family protein
MEVVHGSPFIEIVRSARRVGAELVVLGRHGAGGVQDLLIGSTAERVVRKSPSPVLVVNQEPRTPYRRPVFATDLEEVSRRAIRFALPLLDRSVHTAPVVHAYSIPYEGFVMLRAIPAEGRKLRLAFRADAARQFELFLASVRAPGVRLIPRLRRGDAREMILSEAAHHHSDLIVVGSHARGRVARTLLGSVAERIVSAATCDVLVVRPPGLEVRLP